MHWVSPLFDFGIVKRSIFGYFKLRIIKFGTVSKWVPRTSGKSKTLYRIPRDFMEQISSKI